MATHVRSGYTQSNSLANESNVHDVAGEKEDISDIIGLISPYDTPCYSTFRKVSAVAPVSHWQEDELRDAQDNAAVEGADAASPASASTPGITFNYHQLFEETATVSSTAGATQWHGRASEMDYQIMKRGRELKRDIERALVGVTNASVAGNATTAREMGSCDQFIDSATTVTGIARALSESEVLECHQKVFEAGGDPNWLLVSPYHSTIVANFAYTDPTASAIGAGRERDTRGETRLVNKVDLYVGPFGELTVVTDRWVKGSAGSPAANNGSVFLLETDRWFIPELQPMSVEDLAKTGHADKKLVSCELTVGHENAKASGVIDTLFTV